MASRLIALPARRSFIGVEMNAFIFRPIERSPRVRKCSEKDSIGIPIVKPSSTLQVSHGTIQIVLGRVRGQRGNRGHEETGDRPRFLC
jgi:hypothetical protein